MWGSLCHPPRRAEWQIYIYFKGIIDDMLQKTRGKFIAKSDRSLIFKDFFRNRQ